MQTGCRRRINTAKFLTMTTFVMLLLFSANAHAQTISISIDSDSGGVALAGSGTHNAGFSTGTVTRIGVSLPVGITETTTPTDWTLSTSFLVRVTKDAALTSTSYQLQAILSASDAPRVWKVDSVRLNAVAAATINVNEPYDNDAVHTVAVTIPNNAAAGAFSNTIALTAISN